MLYRHDFRGIGFRRCHEFFSETQKFRDYLHWNLGIFYLLLAFEQQTIGSAHYAGDLFGLLGDAVRPWHTDRRIV